MKELSFVSLKTPFFDTVGAMPLPDYPRPQLQRNSFLNLNGTWQYAILPAGAELSEYQGDILVPFSPEASLSGVGRQVTPQDTLYYHRRFEIPKGFLKTKTLLHFTAVDYSCEVTVNGKIIGYHQGGYLPFSFDVTGFVEEGLNDISLTVNDPTDTGCQSRGKQKLAHSGIWYTPQSGIWGTVWMESLPKHAVRDLTITPDIDTKTVKIAVDTDAEKVLVAVVEDDKLIAKAIGKDEITVELPDCVLWSPENPKLYQLAVMTDGEAVTSYFGMRKFGIIHDKDGHARLMLNNQPYFHNGVLDQGYWPDGLMTAPSDEAMVNDLTMAKELGFNMVRKHVKIEPLRWYYHCDRLGLIVWQDMVNGGDAYLMRNVSVLPFVGIQFNDHDYEKFGRTNEAGRKEFLTEVDGTVKLLKNCVSVAMWVLFNEGWGQFDSEEITAHVRKLDPTRTVDSTSGWHDQYGGDFRSIHTYYKPIRVPKDDRVIILSEFGGYSLPIDGHRYCPDKAFGYRQFDSRRQWQEAFKELYEQKIMPGIKQGLSATVFTQLTDVEEEVNGFVTYDRQLEKHDRSAIRDILKKVKY